MKKQHETRNLSMVMDFYEMTMANGYFASRDTDTLAVFDVFYRKNPDNAGFAIFAGLWTISGIIASTETSTLCRRAPSFIPMNR